MFTYFGYFVEVVEYILDGLFASEGACACFDVAYLGDFFGVVEVFTNDQLFAGIFVTGRASWGVNDLGNEDWGLVGLTFGL